MKIVFLDIDGVLNSYNTYYEKENAWQNSREVLFEIDDSMVERLVAIVEATDAKLVLSSTWKIFFDKKDGKIIPIAPKGQQLVEKLQEHDLELYDTTPTIDLSRGKEILKWLLIHDDIESFVILDDQKLDILEYFKEEDIVATKFGGRYNRDNLGLLDNNVTEAISKLNPFVKRMDKSESK